MRRALFVLPLLTALCAAACTPLEALDEGKCGNGVVDEATEDCEPFDGSQFKCRAPGEPLECTIECHSDAECPTGWGCGVGDLCRRPAGSFESTPFVQAGSKADTLLSGDFDADGREDVVAVEPGRARIYFTDSSGNLDQTNVGSQLPPAIGKLGALQGTGTTGPYDATDDLVLPLQLGLGALLASEGSRSFKSKAYGSLPLDSISLEIQGYGKLVLEILNALPVPVDAVPSQVGEYSGVETAAMLELRTTTKDGKTVTFTVFAPFASQEQDKALFALGGTTIDGLSGAPVTGNFDADPCDEITFPRSDSTHLIVYKLCKGENFVYHWASPAKEEDAIVADVDVGAAIDGPAFARDMNGDGLLDLAVPVSAGAGRELRVAYGTGTGAFHSSPSLAPGDPPDNQAKRYAMLPGAPLALADLDGDGVIDLVDSGGVARGNVMKDNNGEIIDHSFVPWSPASRAWTDAAVADINGDGLQDVLASSDGATDIDVLIHHPSGFWNPSQISTAGTVSQLVTGDFDGDLVADVVFDDSVSPTESQLMIAYGRTSGGPEEATEVATYESIEHIVAGDVRTFGEDSITDLGAMTSKAAETDAESGSKERAFSFFPGTATRLLQAPLVLNEAGKSPQTPLATAVGLVGAAAGEKAEHLDALVLTTEGEASTDDSDPLAAYKRLASTMHIWTLFGADGEAEFDTELSNQCAMPGCFHFQRLDSAHSIAAATSTDGAFLVAATPYMTFTGTGDGDFEVSSLVARLRPDNPDQCWSEVGDVFASGAGELFYRLRLADLDTNGIPEVLVIKKTYDTTELQDYLVTSVKKDVMNPGGPAGPSSLSVLRSELLVIWDGDFTKAYELPGGSEDVRDFTVGEIDGDGNPDLLVLDGTRLRRFLTSNATQELTATDDLTAPAIPAGGAQAVLLADVDGDGVQDITLRGDSLQVFRGNRTR